MRKVTTSSGCLVTLSNKSFIIIFVNMICIFDIMIYITNSNCPAHKFIFRIIKHSSENLNIFILRNHKFELTLASTKNASATKRNGTFQVKDIIINVNSISLNAYHCLQCLIMHPIEREIEKFIEFYDLLASESPLNNHYYSIAANGTDISFDQLIYC